MSLVAVKGVAATDGGGGVERWRGWNTLRVAVEAARERGVSTETVTLLMLLPVIATLVSVLHYIVGLSGYGIFMPTMISVALLATGIVEGLMLFAVVLVISVGSNWLLKRLRLHFWPARSIGLMMVAVAVFGLMAVTAGVGLAEEISIFPVLFMIMLSEEFVRTQLVKSGKEAKKLTLGTLALAVAGALIMKIGVIREWVLMYPDLAVVLVVVINVAVGNYTGIRLTEIGRFRGAVRVTSLKK